MTNNLPPRRRVLSFAKLGPRALGAALTTVLQSFGIVAKPDPDAPITAFDIWQATRIKSCPWLREHGHACEPCSAQFQVFHRSTYWHRGSCKDAWQAKAIWPQEEVGKDARTRDALAGKARITPDLVRLAGEYARPQGPQSAHDRQRGEAATGGAAWSEQRSDGEGGRKLNKHDGERRR